MEKPVYIHYGAKVFDPGKGFPIRNRENWTKPAGGLWASRETSAFGWKDWCERESFRVCDASNTFRFVLRDVAEVGRVSRMDDLKRLPNKAGKLWPVIPDFEECLCRGYDAVELCCYGGERQGLTADEMDFLLWGWDCDSIVVLNPEAVTPVSRAL